MQCEKSRSPLFPREGVTLVEALVVIGITAAILGILLSAVMRVREAARVAQSKNNLRQITLAILHFGNVNQNRLPSIDANDQSVNRDCAFFASLLPYIEEGPAYMERANHQNQAIPIKTFCSPADPTIVGAFATGNFDVSSYAANARVFLGDPSIPGTFEDGMSSTILFAEHYALCKDNMFLTFFSGIGFGGIPHRPSFADLLDTEPITQGSPPQSNVPDCPPFQVAPAPKDCAWSLPQTPHPGGMLVALGDGSIRTLQGGIDPTLFWGAVTPAGGEILSGW